MNINKQLADYLISLKYPCYMVVCRQNREVFYSRDDNYVAVLKCDDVQNIDEANRLINQAKRTGRNIKEVTDELHIVAVHYNESLNLYEETKF